MRHFQAITLMVIMLLFPLALGAQNPSAADVFPKEDYLIGPGDVLLVSVWKDQAMTQSLPVRPDGKISFPLIGEVRAGGRSVAQVTADMEEKLSRYVPDPVLTIGIQEIRSMIIYVIGRVNAPGRFALHANVNVLQALAMAGGCNTFADSKNIKVFRQVGERTLILDFNYNEVAAGKRLNQNIMLERGDVIVVP